MNRLNGFLCDWGSPDSNMLLFFLLISFLLGLLAGWLIWGRKIQAALDQIKERDATNADLNSKLILKETDLAKANKSNEELMALNRKYSEEKGQLHSKLITLKDDLEKSKSKSSASVSKPIATEVTAPTVMTEAIVTPQAEVQAKKVAKKVASGKDDLKIVEGIGPKIEGLLNDAGILTFLQLSETAPEQIKNILDAAGRRYQMHDPTTWPKQSLMAHEGKWDELKVWQDSHKGGKE